MTKPPTPRQVDAMLAADRDVVKALADLVEQRTRPTPTPPTPKAAPKRTTTKPPTPKGPPVRRRSKATAKQVPRRSKVTMRLATDVPDDPPTWLHEQERERLSGDTLRTSTSAHDVNAFTPCRVCAAAVAPSGDRWGTWREHRECARIAASAPGRVTAAARVLGIGEVTGDVAALVTYRVPLYSDVHREPTWLPSDRKRGRGAWRTWTSVRSWPLSPRR